MRKIVAPNAGWPGGCLDSGSEWLYHENADVERFLQRFDTIFFGRIAYERLTLPINGHLEGPVKFFAFDRIRKYVFTRKYRHLPGNGMIINGNIKGEVARIRDEDGKDIFVWGGPTIIHSLDRLRLIDEYVAAIFPVDCAGWGMLSQALAAPLPHFQLRNHDRGI